jgi:hypothetical protein
MDDSSISFELDQSPLANHPQSCGLRPDVFRQPIAVEDFVPTASFGQDARGDQGREVDRRRQVLSRADEGLRESRVFGNRFRWQGHASLVNVAEKAE